MVVDVQNDFCAGGSLAVSGAEDAIEAINALREREKKQRVFNCVVLTADDHPENHVSFAASHGPQQRRPFEKIIVPRSSVVLDGTQVERPEHEQVLWPVHCVQRTHGASFHPSMQLDGSELILRKGSEHVVDANSGFWDNTRIVPTGLHALLREKKVKRLLVVGIATDVCVLATVRDAIDLGYSVTLTDDCCAAVSDEGRRQALDEMRKMGCVVFSSHVDALSAIQAQRS